MRTWRTNPVETLTVTRGAECWVFDADGKPYLDLLSGTWCNVLGYGHPRWQEAISEQVSKLAHVGPQFLTEEVERALNALAEVLPPALTRAVLLNTGSEAVELALKMARAATGAHEVAVVERSYYGATICALSLSEAGRGAPYLPAPEWLHRLPAPFCARCPLGRSEPCADGFPCLDPLERLAEEAERGNRRIAAVLFEPVLANGGVIVPPIGYGARLRALATCCGALLVTDEVTTGLGRTGRWLGCEHEGIVPDILILGKALGAGLPVAAVATTEDVEARCQGVLTHIQSHQNDPFSARVAATVISVLKEERLIEGPRKGLSSRRAQLRSLPGRDASVPEAAGVGLSGLPVPEDATIGEAGGHL